MLISSHYSPIKFPLQGSLPLWVSSNLFKAFAVSPCFPEPVPTEANALIFAFHHCALLCPLWSYRPDAENSCRFLSHKKGEYWFDFWILCMIQLGSCLSVVFQPELCRNLKWKVWLFSLLNAPFYYLSFSDAETLTLWGWGSQISLPPHSASLCWQNWRKCYSGWMRPTCPRRN